MISYKSSLFLKVNDPDPRINVGLGSGRLKNTGGLHSICYICTYWQLTSVPVLPRYPYHLPVLFALVFLFLNASCNIEVANGTVQTCVSDPYSFDTDRYGSRSSILGWVRYRTGTDPEAFALLDPDPEPEYGSGYTDLIESGSETLVQTHIFIT
jgi:hypothetical protein